MVEQQLISILAEAYKPCQHFSGSCSGVCVWDPPRGLVPCAFGGATGALKDVQLLIVTAEPGDPPDAEGYAGEAEQMVRNSLRIFHEAMEKYGIERRGRPTPFHRNMRRILDVFWPNENLENQLRKTWATNAVLCPARVTGGRHPIDVVKACTQSYLVRQIKLFPNAFILALGNKARDRMQVAKLTCDTVGLHPSARKSTDVKLASWKAAADKFRQRQGG